MSLDARASPRGPNLDRSRSCEALPSQAAPRGAVRLALAVLADAVRCLKGSHGAWNFPPRLFRWEAEQWIESRGREPRFSFENICSILDLDANDLRGEIGRRRAQPCRQSRGGSRRPSTAMTGVRSTRRHRLQLRG